MSRHPLDNVRRFPQTCIWEITGSCNLDCLHCGNRAGERTGEDLSYEQMIRVADSLENLGCKMVDLTGGEPLLNPHWDSLARELTLRGMQVALITNGTLLNSSALERAIAAGVRVIAISVDGLQDVHDRLRVGLEPDVSPWKKSMDALSLALENVSTKVISQVNVFNLHQLADLRDLLREMGVLEWQLQLAIPTGRLQCRNEPEPYVLAPRHLDELTDFIVENAREGQPPFIDTSDSIGYYTAKEPFLRKRQAGQGVWLGCQAGIRSVAITYDGSVRGCSLMPAEFDAGNLHSETLEQIWQEEERFSFSTRFESSKLSGRCSRCRFGALCRAGCTTMAYWSTGSIYENPYCLMSQGET